jgi:hypothetical protein
MTIMLIVTIGCVLSAPPYDILVKHSSMDANPLRYVWIEAMHFGTPWVVETPIVM